MAIPSRKTNNASSSTAARYGIRGSSAKKEKIPMARKKDILPGEYRSKIVKVSITKTRAGDEAVEVIYELTAADGKVFKMREIIPIDSWAFEKFGNAMIAAGLEENEDLEKTIGVTEDVTLTYDEPGGLGHFSKRVPVVATTDAAEDEMYDSEEDEYADLSIDVLLDEDEDEDE